MFVPGFLGIFLNLSNFEGAVFNLDNTIKSLSPRDPEKAEKATKSFDLMVFYLKGIIDEYKGGLYTESGIKTLEELLSELRQTIYPILEDKKDNEYEKLAKSLISLRSALIKKDISGLENYIGSIRQPTAFLKQDREVVFLHERPSISSKFDILVREIMRRVWNLLNNDPVISRLILFFSFPFFVYLFFICVTDYEFDPFIVVYIFGGSAVLAAARR